MNATITKVGLIGAGTMGNGIAQAAAASRLEVVMLDVSEGALERGLGSISKSLERLVSKGKLTSADVGATLARIQVSTNYEAVGAADLVIEAATESEGLKLSILKKIEEHVGPTAIIASNTSSISITRLAAAIGRPERFIGMHFFNPVPLMALVELIRGMQTSDTTHQTAEAFAKHLGKTPITVKNAPGFAVNRILCPMINEAIFALQEGVASAEDIDTGMRLGCNQPIGPLALADLVGLDTLLSVMEVFYQGFNDPKYRPAQLLREMVDAGYLGRKSGRGFYRY